MPNLQSSPSFVQMGSRKQYVTDVFETNIDDWSTVKMDPALRVEILGSAKGLGVNGTGRGVLPSNVMVGKRIGGNFNTSLDRFFVRLYRLN